MTVTDVVCFSTVNVISYRNVVPFGTDIAYDDLQQQQLRQPTYSYRTDNIKQQHNFKVHMVLLKEI